MELYILLIGSLITGFLTKFTDMITDDGLKTIKHLELLTGLSYGVLIAWLTTNFPVIAPVVFATLIAIIFTKKVDSLSHCLGLGSMFFLFALWGIPKINFIYLIVFLIAAISDEILSNFSDSKKFKKPFKKIFELRPTLEIVTFVFSLLTNQWSIWLTILLFDIGYVLTNNLFEPNNFIKKR
jgi:hypothetical protein